MCPVSRDRQGDRLNVNRGRRGELSDDAVRLEHADRRHVGVPVADEDHTRRLVGRLEALRNTVVLTPSSAAP
jgi:hypothetical protein